MKVCCCKVSFLENVDDTEGDVSDIDVTVMDDAMIGDRNDDK